MKLFAIILSFLAFTINVFAQTTDKVAQLVSAENYFSALVKEKGLKKAFLKVSDENTIVFRPGPVSAVKFYKSQPDTVTATLQWEPVFAKISKSGDWGFTTGPYIYKESDSSLTSHYGSYVSVWKKNHKGIWRLATDLGIPHKKPSKKPELLFVNPSNEIFLRQRSQTRLQQREDVVFSTDKLLSTIQKADNAIAHKEFLSDDCQLLFPGFEPIRGKKAITDFWKKQGFRANSQVAAADRSYSGELAFTRGDASIVQKNKIKKYHYVRIWEVQPGFKWNVILEVYTPAEDGETKIGVSD